MDNSPWKSKNDMDRVTRNAAINLGLVQDTRSEFDRRRDEAEYRKEIAEMDDICQNLLARHRNK